MLNGRLGPDPVVEASRVATHTGTITSLSSRGREITRNERMTELRRYRRRADTLVTAVQLALDFEHLTYRKWGGAQTAVSGDWLVDNGGSIYTVNRDTFERTYREVSPGRFEKVESVWARLAEEPGVIETQEGETHYEAGDMVVFNDPRGEDGYAMSAEKFEELYEPAG